MLGQRDQFGGHLVGVIHAVLRQGLADAQQARGRLDDAGLEFDLGRVAVVFGAGHAPAAPVLVVRGDYGECAGLRMVGGFVRLLPAVAGAVDAPVVQLAHLVDRAVALVGRQFAGREIATEADVVEDLQRLIEALHPLRQHAFDHGPCADRLHEHFLVLVE
jgi:hypothetical protein